ncbi:MAG: 4Fe-4S dicluster domain-containing protein [Saccharofermentanales bacterium]
MLMKMKKLNKSGLDAFLTKLSGQYIIVAPVLNDKGFTEFKCTKDFKNIDLGKNPVNAVKEFLFPQNEKLFSYKAGEIIENISEKKILVFGARPCDIKSIETLDKVFLDERYIDLYYQRRRDNLTIIGYSCPQSEPGCFCMSFGIDPTDNDKTALFMFEDKDAYYFKINNINASFIVEEFEDAEIDITSLKKHHDQNFTTGLEFPLDERRIFNAPLWDEVFNKCIGCGTCTYLCPTCHCFEFYNKKNDDSIEKVRCWDSCQYSLFTLHASGHNPRNSQKERFRQRVMHKFSYYPKNYGVAACVGCGRCVRKCPVSLDMRQVLSSLDEYIKESAVQADE